MPNAPRPRCSITSTLTLPVSTCTQKSRMSHSKYCRRSGPPCLLSSIPTPPGLLILTPELIQPRAPSAGLPRCPNAPAMGVLSHSLPSLPSLFRSYLPHVGQSSYVSRSSLDGVSPILRQFFSSHFFCQTLLDTFPPPHGPASSKKHSTHTHNTLPFRTNIIQSFNNFNQLIPII